MRHWVFLLAWIVAFAAAGQFGVDVASPVSRKQAHCLATQANVSYAIVRSYRSTDEPDENCAATLGAFQAAGISDLSVYVFPCAKGCRYSAQEQVARAMQPLQAFTLSRVWLDIEGPGTYWDKGTPVANSQFIADMVQAVVKLNLRPGIYASRYDWSEITGAPFPQGNTSFSQLPLWYALYDRHANFNDFLPFGGWVSPTMKQFWGNDYVCQAGVDRNWRP